MARKITTEAIAAFINGDEKPCNGYGCIFSKDNTCVTRNSGMISLHLHSNRIADRCLESGNIWITAAQWFSNTTKERLNGIPGVSIVQRKGEWYLNGVVWDGSWVRIK